MSRPTVYVETTIIGHLAARQQADFVVAARQLSRTIDEQNRVICGFCAAKDEDRSNTLVYTVGFYVAVWLYEAGSVDDKTLDGLEAVWRVNFVMHRG